MGTVCRQVPSSEAKVTWIRVAQDRKKWRSLWRPTACIGIDLDSKVSPVTLLTNATIPAEQGQYVKAATRYSTKPKSTGTDALLEPLDKFISKLHALHTTIHYFCSFWHLLDADEFFHAVIVAEQLTTRSFFSCEALGPPPHNSPHQRAPQWYGVSFLHVMQLCGIPVVISYAVEFEGFATIKNSQHMN